MKVLIFTSFFSALCFFFSCQSNEQKQINESYSFITKKGAVTISIDSTSFHSTSSLSYFFEANYQNNYLMSFKRYFENEDLSKSLDEWIHFDSLNRVRSIHTAIVNFKPSEMDDQILVEGKLLSNITFDDAFFIIAFDTVIVAFDELDNKLGFQKKYSKKELGKSKKINIEILTLRKNIQDGSISSQSIHKEYLIVDSIPEESIVTKKGLFESEKFNFVQKRYNLW